MVQIEEYREGLVHTLEEDGNSSSLLSTASNGSIQTEVQHPDSDGSEYDLDLPDHPPRFHQFLTFLPRRGGMINIVSNDEPAPANGETDKQRQQHEQRNANHAQRRQAEVEEEECRRGPRPQDLNDTFDMVGDKQVFKTPSANVAAAMAKLQRLPNIPEV